MLPLFKFLACALGHPIVFFSYLTLASIVTSSNSNQTVLGINLLPEVATNVYKINLKGFIPYAIILYFLWVAFQYLILHYVRHITLEEFIHLKFTLTYTILCSLGLINLFFWGLGMEGNAFGFMFAFPLLIITCVLVFYEFRLFFLKV